MQFPSSGSEREGAGETTMESARSDSLVQEIQRGFALMSKLQSLLEQGTCTYAQMVLARALLEEAIEACNNSLFKLMHRETIKVETQTTSVAATRRVPLPHNYDATEGDHGTRMPQDSWEVVTIAPYHDGHQWRKYGEKKISGVPFPRCYYRCTYRGEQGCLARKQVQQQNCDDPPLFMVTYRKEHSCNNIGSPTSYKILLANDIPPPQPFFLQFDSKDPVNPNMKPLHGSMVMANQTLFLGDMLHNDDAFCGQFSPPQQFLALDAGCKMVQQLEYSELDDIEPHYNPLI